MLGNFRVCSAEYFQVSTGTSPSILPTSWWMAGSASEIRDKLSKLQAAGVGMLFIPTFLLPADRLRALDRFMAEVAPAFR